MVSPLSTKNHSTIHTYTYHLSTWLNRFYEPRHFESIEFPADEVLAKETACQITLNATKNCGENCVGLELKQADLGAHRRKRK